MMKKKTSSNDDYVESSGWKKGTSYYIVASCLAVVLAMFFGTQNASGFVKQIVPHTINLMWQALEDYGIIPPVPVFDTEYAKTLHPAFIELEENWKIVAEEAMALLPTSTSNFDDASNITGIKDLDESVWNETTLWKTFVLNLAGQPIPENIMKCPETGALLAKLPDVVLSWYSILYPKQHIVPHHGFYKGLTRYHLGLHVPNNNLDQKVYIKMNKQLHESNQHNGVIDHDRNEQLMNDHPDTITYYWHNGEGMIFDDTYLHYVVNDYDSPRIVLFVDLPRPGLPWILDKANKLFIWIGNQDNFITTLKKRAISGK